MMVSLMWPGRAKSGLSVFVLLIKFCDPILHILKADVRVSQAGRGGRGGVPELLLHLAEVPRLAE